MSGRVVPSYLYFIPIITGTLFFYRTHQVKHAILMLALAFINLVALEFTDYATFSNELVLSPHQVKIRVVICLTVSLTLGAILMRELIVMNLYNQRKLRRLNQNLKKRNERLRKINNELDSFVYRSSHDLRSPLTSIMGIINIIRSETSIEKVQEYMSFQERSVKKLDSLIQDILDISRNSRLGLVVGPVFLKQFVEKSLDSLSYMEEYKKVTVIVDIPENMTIYSDTNRLKVVFNNLLSNGLRYCDLSKPHSTVHVTVVSVNKQGVRIEVKDNGIGVRKEHMSKIFDMFYRATDRNNGSGLGLYIVKEAVTKLGGKVAFTSTYGEGTTVSLFLPDIAPPFEQVEMSNGTLFVNS